jgi:hypothetical protein
LDGEELPQDRQKGAPENRQEGQTLPQRQVPQKKPETCQDASTLVLSKMPKPNSRIGARGYFHVLRKV